MSLHRAFSCNLKPRFRLKSQALVSAAEFLTANRVFSIGGALTDLRNWTYRAAYHYVELNRDGGGTHSLSANSEDIHVFEAGLSVPWRKGQVELNLRLQDDQPNTPGEKDFEAATEVGWLVKF